MPLLASGNELFQLADYSTCASAGDLSDDSDQVVISDPLELKASDVRHATAIQVDRATKETKATEAPAIKSAGFNLASNSGPLVIDLNRPFAFVIYDTTNNLAIFVGKLSDPNSPQTSIE